MATLRGFALLCLALALGGGLAHLYALPNKIDLPPGAYLAAQHAYRGWWMLGAAIVGALVSLTVQAVKVRHDRRALGLTLLALALLIAAQVLFWMFTFPANRATFNWTVLPAGWESLRRRWEYSHAFGAGLTLLAFVALLLTSPRDDERQGIMRS
jgi:hypothetical protein